MKNLSLGLAAVLFLINFLKGAWADTPVVLSSSAPQAPASITATPAIHQHRHHPKKTVVATTSTSMSGTASTPSPVASSATTSNSYPRGVDGFDATGKAFQEPPTMH